MLFPGCVHIHDLYSIYLVSVTSCCCTSLCFHAPHSFPDFRPADFFPPPELVEERGLARPVVAGIVATICFLAAAVLFSTMAACFVNKQRRRKLKRKRGEVKLIILNYSPFAPKPETCQLLKFVEVLQQPMYHRAWIFGTIFLIF